MRYARAIALLLAMSPASAMAGNEVPKISDEQIRSGLGASGATPSEMDCYTQSFRSRIEQLRQVTTVR